MSLMVLVLHCQSVLPETAVHDHCTIYERDSSGQAIRGVYCVNQSDGCQKDLFLPVVHGIISTIR